jgi:phage terminase small subunit
MSAAGRDETGLTPRQRRFCLEYLADKELNATRAARRAGYSAKTADVQAARLFRNARVSAFIGERLKKREEKLELTAARIDEEIARLALLDIRGAYDAEGRLLNPADMPEDVRRALAGFEEEALFDQVDVSDGERDRKVRVQVGVVRKVKWASKPEMLALAAKRLGLLIDKAETKVVEEVKPADLTDEEWAALALLRHGKKEEAGAPR